MGKIEIRRALRQSLTFGAIACSGFAGAWIDTGHMVIASIAEDNLTPAARLQINALLSGDPDPRSNTFVTSSCWADDTKNKQSAPWHYHDIFFRTDGKEVLNEQEGESALTALDQFTKVLRDRTKTPGERLRALKFIVHIVGDLHQPLHCVARETDALPKGDRGGNDFKVISPKGWDPAPRNLHFLWDLGGGLFMPVPRPLTAEGDSQISLLKLEIKRLHPERSFPQARDLNPVNWLPEGMKLARELVYNLPENSVPSPVYLAHAQATSARQAALAGYRLAALLNSLLG
jgi:hypothetical protein